MISEQVGQGPIRADGDSGRACKIIFGDRCPLFLVVLSDVVGGHAANDGFDLFPVRIVVEVGRRRAGHRDDVVSSQERFPVGARDRIVNHSICTATYAPISEPSAVGLLTETRKLLLHEY